MSDPVTCPACGSEYTSLRGFYAHWGQSDDEAHAGETPDMDRELEFSDEHRERISEAKEGHTHDEETRERIAEAARGNDPWNKGMTKEDDERLRHIAECIEGTERPDEVKEKLSRVKKREWENGVFDDRDVNPRTGEDCNLYRHGNWTPYSYTDAYPDEFDEKLRADIRERDSHTCQRCGGNDFDYRLHVHHIDADKMNNDPNNLIALCSTCHKTMEYRSETVQRMVYSMADDPSWGITETVVV